MGGTICSKQFGLTSNWWYVGVAMVSSAFASLTWSFVMRRGGDLSSFTPMMSVSLIITTVLIGLAAYHEPLSMTKIVGILLGVVAVFLIIK
jgi:drug/metabolite transporter (DMT)-like permease